MISSRANKAEWRGRHKHRLRTRPHFDACFERRPL